MAPSYTLRYVACNIVYTKEVGTLALSLQRSLERIRTYDACSTWQWLCCPVVKGSTYVLRSSSLGQRQRQQTQPQLDPLRTYRSLLRTLHITLLTLWRVIKIDGILSLFRSPCFCYFQAKCS